MKLYLIGHDYKYAVEQMLLTLFPGEKPEYPTADEPGDKLVAKLSKARHLTTATCTLKINGKLYHGKAAMAIADDCGQVELDRDCQKIIKNAIYRAALASGIKHPAWGALTGVRPGKLLAGMISSGMSEKQALSAFIREYDVTPERASLCMDTTRETLKAMAGLESRDVCLYVGIPFCPTRCAYCSFVSQSVEKSIKLIEPFLQALRQEISATARQIKALDLRVVAIYMGGGTPTTLSAKQLDELCKWLEQDFDLSHLREYTVEAGRPDTITIDKLRVLRRHGVDRLSVNPQTMDDGVLQLIGRKHTAADIISALEIVRQVGGFAVNMDLIAGLPGDNLEQFRYTLDKVLDLAPENITVHTLSLKKGSRITLEGSPIPDGQEVSAMLDLAGQRLRADSYSPYYLYRQKFMSGGFENVGWTKEGYVNLYNICIMEEICSVVAMGGGGSTKLIKAGEGRNIRLVAPKYPLEYIENIEKTCSDKQKISEFYKD
jgi:oxygen-independent coproporphyrinogen-3 oxidase